MKFLTLTSNTWIGCCLRNMDYLVSPKTIILSMFNVTLQGYDAACDVWSLGITMLELAEVST